MGFENLQELHKVTVPAYKRFYWREVPTIGKVIAIASLLICTALIAHSTNPLHPLKSKSIYLGSTCGLFLAATLFTLYTARASEKLHSFEALGIQSGPNILVFTDNFNEQAADRPHLFLTDGCGNIAHLGRTIVAKQHITEDRPGNRLISSYSYRGLALLKYIRNDILGVGVFHHWAANFAALNSI